MWGQGYLCGISVGKPTELPSRARFCAQCWNEFLPVEGQICKKWFISVKYVP